MTIAENDLILEMMTRIRDANLAGQSTIEVPATQSTVHLAQILKSHKLITDFQSHHGVAEDQLTIHLASSANPSKAANFAEYQQQIQHYIDDPTLPKELAIAFQDLTSENAEIRSKAVIALGALFSE